MEDLELAEPLWWLLLVEPFFFFVDASAAVAVATAVTGRMTPIEAIRLRREMVTGWLRLTRCETEKSGEIPPVFA